MPRMQPDGTVKMTNIGTVENPVIVAAPGTPLEQMVQAMRELGIAAEEQALFLDSWVAATEGLLHSPQEELLFRLNATLRGDDPGEPFNLAYWRP